MHTLFAAMGRSLTLAYQLSNKQAGMPGVA